MKKNKKILIFVGLLLIVFIVFVSLNLVSRKKNSDKTVNIAFYGMSEEYVDLIKKNISEIDDVEIKYTVFADGKFDLHTVSSKYDMLFTWKGEYTDILSESAEVIPNKILDNIPVSLRDKKCIPILLDHYELDFKIDVVSKTKIYPYDDMKNFEKYLDESKAYVFVPFFMAGGNDRNLLAFIASLVESKGGIESYNKFIEVLKTEEDFNSIIDIDLGKKIKLRSILDRLKEWPKDGLTHPMWFTGKDNDVVYFSEEDQVGVFYTNLATHRKMSYQNVKKFETSNFPRYFTSVEHGVIAPSICAMLLSENKNSKKILINMMSENIQSEMSQVSKLAPVHYRAQPYDKQADNVRFWVASCAGGALPDPCLAVYQKNPDKLQEMASKIREYLKR